MMKAKTNKRILGQVNTYWFLILVICGCVLLNNQNCLAQTSQESKTEKADPEKKIIKKYMAPALLDDPWGEEQTNSEEEVEVEIEVKEDTEPAIMKMEETEENKTELNETEEGSKEELKTEKKEEKATELKESKEK